MNIHKVSNTSIVAVLIISVLTSIICSDVMIDRIVMSLTLVSCIIFGIKEKSFLNPYFLFLLTPISLLIYFNVGGLFMVELTHNTWLLGIINSVAFILALNFTPAFSNTKNCVSISDSKLGMHATFMFALAIVSLFVPAISSVLFVFAFPAFACVIKSKKKFLYILPILYIVITFMGSLSKTTVLSLLVTLLFCYEKYFVNDHKQRKKLIALSVVSLFFMILAFSFANKDRGNYDADEGMIMYESQGVEWNYGNSLFLPYMYFTTGWANLQYVTETQDSRTYGLWLVKPALGYFQLNNNFEKSYELVPYSGFNTFTFITCGYKDFGYWLSIISAVFLGFFVKKVYSRFLVSNSPLDVGVYVLVGLATLEMFFSNHFFMQSYPFTIYIVMELYKILFLNGRNVEIDQEPA